MDTSTAPAVATPLLCQAGDIVVLRQRYNRELLHKELNVSYQVAEQIGRLLHRLGFGGSACPTFANTYVVTLSSAPWQELRSRLMSGETTEAILQAQSSATAARQGEESMRPAVQPVETTELAPAMTGQTAPVAKVEVEPVADKPVARSPLLVNRTSTSQEFRLSDIHVDPHLQVRADVDQDMIDEYTQAMKDGAVFPPIQLTATGNGYRLVDGRHRFEAANRIGLKTINAEVITAEGPMALATAIKANSAHGRQLSSQEKREALERLLQDSVVVGWSDRSISRATGLSGALVADCRKHICIPRADAQRLVGRGGKTFTMNTAAIGSKKAGKRVARVEEMAGAADGGSAWQDDRSTPAMKTDAEQPARVASAPAQIDRVAVDMDHMASALADLRRRVKEMLEADRPRLHAVASGMLQQVEAIVALTRDRKTLGESSPSQDSDIE